MSFPAPGDLPDPGIKTESLASPALAGRFFTSELIGKPVKDQTLEQKMVLVLLPLRKLQGTLCREPGAKTKSTITTSHRVPLVFCFLVFTHLFSGRGRDLGRQGTEGWMSSHLLEAG